MLPRSAASTVNVSASTVTPVAPRNYHLPGDDDAKAWRDLLLPFAGRLRLPHNSGRKKKAICQCFGGPAAEPQPAVDIWLQCGLHYCTASDGDVTPVPGRPFPAAAGERRGWVFLPLRRDAPDGTRFFDVRVQRAGGGGTGAATAARKGARADSGWVVQVHSSQSPPAFNPVTFVADNKGDAIEWERQLVMRAAPLSVVWQRALGGPPVGGGSAAGPSARPWVGGARAVSDAVSKLIGSGAPDALTGVVAAVFCDEVFDAVTSAGSCVAFVVGALATVVRVCAAAASMRGFAEELRNKVQSLSSELGSHLLPAVVSLDEAGSANAAMLLNKVAVVAADLDVLVGKLLHLSVSKTAIVREAAIAAGRTEALSLVHEVEACRAAVAALQSTTTLDVCSQHMKQTTDAARVAHDECIEDARALLAVPTVTDRIVAEWGDAHAAQPWCRLLKMVMREPPQSEDGMCACVVSALGMGGVGKTTVCTLVAQQVAEDNADRRRYDGVYWVQLSQEVVDATVIQFMEALATAVGQKKVTAPSIPVAVDRLQLALAGKAVLVVVDDCWHDRLATYFKRAVQLPQSGRCCLLFSTRLERIAGRVAGADRVMQIKPMEPAAGKDLLLAYARGTGSSAMRRGGKNEDPALSQLLEAAAGLPLALAVLGSLVRAEGWAKAAKLLRFALAQGAYPENSQYPNLWACFDVSSRQLDAKGDLYARLLNALCVVEKQELLPLSALSALWGTSDEDTGVYARHLADLALVTVRPATDGGDGLVLRLHDLVIDWVRGYRVSPPGERQPHHKALVERYGSRLSGESQPLPCTGQAVGCRPWWLLSADGYIEQTLCRHLRSAGLGRELVALLCDCRWIQVRVGHSGGTAVAYRADCRVSGVALMERVATILEGALAAAKKLGIPAMQLMAFEVIERFQGASLAGGDERDVVEWLPQSARQYQSRPSITLSGSSRLSLPQEVSILYGHRQPVNCTCVVQDLTGKIRVVSGSRDNTLRVWDADRGECLAVLEGHTDTVTCVCVVEVGGGGDGGGGGAKVQRVVSGSRDNTLRVWDADRGECVAVLEGHSSEVRCVCVVEVGGGGDGGGGGVKVQRVVSGSEDNTLRMWEADRGECVAVLEGHTDTVRCVCVVEVGGGGDGGGGGCGAKVQRVVSGSADDTLRVWDADRGECVAVLEGHTDTVTCVSVVEVGGGGDGALREK